MHTEDHVPSARPFAEGAKLSSGQEHRDGNPQLLTPTSSEVGPCVVILRVHI